MKMECRLEKDNANIVSKARSHIVQGHNFKRMNFSTICTKCILAQSTKALSMESTFTSTASEKQLIKPVTVSLANLLMHYF